MSDAPPNLFDPTYQAAAQAGMAALKNRATTPEYDLIVALKAHARATGHVQLDREMVQYTWATTQSLAGQAPLRPEYADFLTAFRADPELVKTCRAELQRLKDAGLLPQPPMRTRCHVSTQRGKALAYMLAVFDGETT